MHFSLIVFVMTLCLSAYKTSGSEPAKMANPDERARRTKIGEEDNIKFNQYWKERQIFESTLKEDNTADHVERRKSFETDMFKKFEEDLTRYTQMYDDIMLARSSLPNGKR